MFTEAEWPSTFTTHISHTGQAGKSRNSQSHGPGWLMPDHRTPAITNPDVPSDACSWSDPEAVFARQVTTLTFCMGRAQRPARYALEWVARRDGYHRKYGPSRVSPGLRVRWEALAPASVARLIKRAMRCTGSKEEAFATHSLRPGRVTPASLNNVCFRAIIRRTGYQSSLGRYVRVLGKFEENESIDLGLAEKYFRGFLSVVFWSRPPLGISIQIGG